MQSPRVVSVIVGTRNRPDTLRDALASIRAIEGPDLTFEILVGDNGTTLETERVVAEFGGLYGKTDVYGCPAARNVAMQKMSGDFVAFLDDDDVWTRDNIRPQIALLDANPQFAAAFGQILITNQNLEPIEPAWPTEWPEDNNIYLKMLSGYFPQVGGTVVRGDIARECGLMDESLIGDSDWDWQLRFVRDHEVGFVPVVAVKCRARPPGSFDVLQAKRAKYTRKIFIRHARETLSRWSSVVAVAKSYFTSIEGYYYYFTDAAIDRSENADRPSARKAFWCAFKLNPFRLISSVIRPSALRRAFRLTFLPWADHGALKQDNSGV